jgi:hypothetical protein
MRHFLYRSAVIIAASLAIIATSDTAAARGHGASGSRSSSSSSSGHHHHHHHRFVGGAFFFGTTVYPWPWPGYPYAPVMPYDAPPAAYVEQYPGTPTPDTQDWIFCPSAGASYPDVQECPRGWQRVIPNPQSPPAAGG